MSLRSNILVYFGALNICPQEGRSDTLHSLAIYYYILKALEWIFLPLFNLIQLKVLTPQESI